MARPKAKVAPKFAGIDPLADAIRARDPFQIVIFGASGDLAKRKLVPALAQLQRAGYLPEKLAITGFARTQLTDDSYRESMLESLREHVGEDVEPSDPILRAMHYVTGDVDDAGSFERLKKRLEEAEGEHGLPGNRLYYLSVAPEYFPVIIEKLGRAGLIRDPHDPVWTRVVIEKPFGHDLESARALSRLVRSVLDESQIYRIDHYLGKETVQNILSFRFGNSIFEPLFNKDHVAGVQITVAETLGMEGRRGVYYDQAGVLRDMVQNHLLQLLSLIAMEPPAALEAQAIRDEKVKVVRCLQPMTVDEVALRTVRGQYGSGANETAYREETGVAPASNTETYVALKVHIDNWRWAGVPFLLRSGKRLNKRVSEIAVQFKQPPLRLFHPTQSREELGDVVTGGNTLVIRIQPDEGISLSFACKVPGMRIQLAEVDMDFLYNEAFTQRSPLAYERLLLDALRGDPSLFTRSDEVEYAWRFVTSILEGWDKLPPPDFPNYEPLTDGPAEADRLVDGTGIRWRALADM